ncbi:MAG: HAMP domain-containing sensor histidine kinase [Pseudomonadota bacterium]
MSEPTTPQNARGPDAGRDGAGVNASAKPTGYSSTFGTIRRKPDIATRVTAEEIRLLIDLGQSSSMPIFIGILIVGFAFWGAAPLWVTGIVLSIQIIAQTYFNHVRAGFRADPDVVPNALVWARRYAVGCFLSGLTWGVGGLLWLQNATFAQQIFYALVLSSVSVATVITRSTYLPAAVTYISTAVTPTIIIMLIQHDPLQLATVGLSLMFLYTLVAWTRHISRAYREAIRLRFDNADLVERMARAHAATEQKRFEAEAAEIRAKAADRAKREFLDILGKEVSLPLETLSAMAAQLSREPLSEAQSNLAQAMSASSDRLQGLFHDMIDFSQMEAHTLTLHLTHFDPVDFVKTIARDLRPLAARQHLSLELDVVPSSLTSIRADAERLRQVLTNLISNGIKFTESGGVILRMQRADLPDGKAALRFSVIDTGIGLTQDARTHLFEGFAKGSDKAAGGMGLGLAISDRLVRLMGGHIEVDSAPGQGSTFWFLLPCETSDAAPLTVPAPAAETSSRARSQRFIDQDYLYEMERELGAEKATDRMIEALHNILSLYEKIEQARREDNSQDMAVHAQSMQTVANMIGLVAIADAARAIETREDDKRSKEVPHLHKCISETWSQLARAYPGIAMNEPDA